MNGAEIIKFPDQEERLRRKAPSGFLRLDEIAEELWPEEKEGRLCGWTPWYRPETALLDDDEDEP